MGEVKKLIALKPLCNRGCNKFRPICVRGTHTLILN